MVRWSLLGAVLFAATATVASAQEWELGVLGGFGYSPSLTVKNATTSASTGVKNGAAIGFYAGEEMYRYFSGEATYLFRTGDLKLESGATKFSFGTHTHLITGDFLAHLRPRGARFRPFISFGGGIEILQGTGEESANPPLKTLAALTATREVLPVGEAGVGVKYQISKHLRLRVQARDYISQAPHDVIAPVPGATLSGIRNDIIATGAIALTW